MWKTDEVISFASDCVQHGVKSVSLGGGEPFEYEGLWEVIDALFPICYLSITSNGIPLEDKKIWRKLQEHKPDKIHLTIHNPDQVNEVKRVFDRLSSIQTLGIKPGINLLVGHDKVEYAHNVYQAALNLIDSSQIIIVPQRFSNTPSPEQLSYVAGGKPFQSPSCLLGCKRPDNFCSVSWDKKVNFCSFAFGKASLQSLTYEGLTHALNMINWKSCC